MSYLQMIQRLWFQHETLSTDCAWHLNSLTHEMGIKAEIALLGFTKLGPVYTFALQHHVNK